MAKRRIFTVWAVLLVGLLATACAARPAGLPTTAGTTMSSPTSAPATSNAAPPPAPPPGTPTSTIVPAPSPVSTPPIPSPNPAASTPVATFAPTSAGTTSVKVYLIALGDGTVGDETIGCGDKVVPVERQVSATRAPLAAAYRELLAIKERSYGEAGLYNALSRADLRINRIAMDGGTARIALAAQSQLAGECDNPRVKAQLEATARQFATVKDVAITLNGVPLDEALSLR